MDKIPNNIAEIINKYLLSLKENNLIISQAYLFGSYAKGTYEEYSDIDIALVSAKFCGDRMADRGMIRKSTIRNSPLIEVIPFAESDFTMENPFAKEIMNHGLRIA
ncbi:MAG TPA: nucleotidyltransferase domain-containing protein [Spirochaetota bacterium]|nr:nucleotidyltransferase domain-containing protein [Spirochaetota bacterium]